MTRELHQGIVIENLNSYFQWHNLPIEVNPEGICNGLAMVYGKYVLQDREQEFMDILEYIASGIHKGSVTDDEVNYFVMEVLLAFDPSLYNQSLSQSNAMNMLSIDGKNLVSAFDFSIVTKDKNWEQIIADIDLQEREVMQISSINHAVSLHKINGVYRVYDPNYTSGYHDFVNEKELIHELHHNVFEYSRGNLGMELHVIRHPDDLEIKRTFPSVTNLYNQHLLDVNAQVKLGGESLGTLDFAILNQDKQSIQYLVDKGAKNIFGAAEEAIIANNAQALSPLLSKITKNSKKNELFELALNRGRQDAFNELLNQPHFSNIYYDENIALHALSWAARGGNPQLLEQCIFNFNLQARKICIENLAQEEIHPPFEDEINDAIEKYIKKLPVKHYVEDKFKPGDVITQAIISGSRECVTLIRDRLVEGGEVLSELDRVHYLLKAIRHNHRYIALELMDKPTKLPPELLQTINLDALALGRTNLTLLKDLEKRGVKFSEMDQLVIAKKEHQQLTMLQSLGVALYTFTSFLKENLLNSNSRGVSANTSAYKAMKQQLQQVKSGQNSDDDSESDGEIPHPSASN